MIFRRRPRETARPPSDVPASAAAAAGREDADVFEISPALIAFEPPTAASEAFQATATALVEQHLASGRRAIALCGAAVGTGVTYTAVNLAAGLAHLGVRTLLVDANLRAPGLQDVIRPRVAGPGLQQMLRSGLDRHDVTHLDVLPELSLVYAGGVAADADALLAGDPFRAFIRTCMRDYGCTIVDTPAANRWTDCRAIAATVGYAAIVGRRGFSFAEDATLLAEQLRLDGVQVIGTIFNAA